MSSPTPGDPHGEGLATWGDYYDADYTLATIHNHLTNMGLMIAKCQEHFPGKRILEIGTGSGIVCIYFSQLGYNVTGLDRDATVISRNYALSRRMNGQARFLVGDMFNLPFHEKSFDACYHQGLMEHFDQADIIRALKIQTTVCRRVIFTVPTRLWSGGVRGDERLWIGAYWRRLLSEFRILDVFGGAYCTFSARALGFAGRHTGNGFLGNLLQRAALPKAGEIGFVIERF